MKKNVTIEQLQAEIAIVKMQSELDLAKAQAKIELEMFSVKVQAELEVFNITHKIAMAKLEVELAAITAPKQTVHTQQQVVTPVPAKVEEATICDPNPVEQIDTDVNTQEDAEAMAAAIKAANMPPISYPYIEYADTRDVADYIKMTVRVAEVADKMLEENNFAPENAEKVQAIRDAQDETLTKYVKLDRIELNGWVNGGKTAIRVNATNDMAMLEKMQLVPMKTPGQILREADAAKLAELRLKYESEMPKPETAKVEVKEPSKRPRREPNRKPVDKSYQETEYAQVVEDVQEDEEEKHPAAMYDPNAPKESIFDKMLAVALHDEATGGIDDTDLYPVEKQSVVQQGGSEPTITKDQMEADCKKLRDNVALAETMKASGNIKPGQEAVVDQVIDGANEFIDMMFQEQDREPITESIWASQMNMILQSASDDKKTLMDAMKTPVAKKRESRMA